VSPKFVCWSPTPKVTVFGDGASTEVITVKQGRKSRALIRYHECLHEKRKRHPRALSVPTRQRRGKATCAHSEKVATCQPGREPSPQTTLTARGSCTYSLRNCENTNACCWRHPACGTLFQQFAHTLKPFKWEKHSWPRGRGRASLNTGTHGAIYIAFWAGRCDPRTLHMVTLPIKHVTKTKLSLNIKELEEVN